MAQADFDFSNKALSGEERLMGFTALSRGLTLAAVSVLHQVQAYNDLLEEELEDNPAATEYLERSRVVVLRGLEWLAAFRGVTDEDLAFESIAVRVLVEGVIERCRKILPDDRDMTLEMLEEEVVVAGSLFQLQELFMKTVQGYMEQDAQTGRTVHVRTSVHDLDERLFRLLRSECDEGSYFALSLGGDGEQFEADKLSSFWDVFPDQYGVGGHQDLGILQNYGMAVAHGGEMAFLRTGGEGHILVLLLPVQVKRNDMQAPHNIGDATLYGTETILLVDDEDMIWDVIIDMLQELGYSVVLAGNGREAVEIYRSNPGEIDLVLLDMVMPELDGHEAFFQLKQIDPNVRVLLSSGYVSEDDARDVLDAGAVGFLQKPYRMIDLARIVRGIFDRT